MENTDHIGHGHYRHRDKKKHRKPEKVSKPRVSDPLVAFWGETKTHKQQQDAGASKPHMMKHLDDGQKSDCFADPRSELEKKMALRLPQGTSPSLSPVQGPSPTSSVTVGEATRFWREEIRNWFPNLHSQTYFLPPLYFNRVAYDVQAVAGLSVLVPKQPSDQPDPEPPHFPTTDVQQNPPLASLVWPDQPVTKRRPLLWVHDMDVREDLAQQKVHAFIRELAETQEEVMTVVSQLEFRKYLDSQVNPVSAAAIRMLPRPGSVGVQGQQTSNLRNLHSGLQGDFDLLIIHSQYGLIVGEVKSVGADPSKIPDLDRAIVTRVKKALKQLDKVQAVLRHLVSDLVPVRVTMALMLPNITSHQLQRALNMDLQVMQALTDCLGASDAADAVYRCLCAEDINSPKSSEWWQRTVTNHGPDRNMTPELYEILVARFCGPATTVEVPTVTAPRRTVGLRTLSESVAHAGLTMSLLTLYPRQVELVSKPELQRVFLVGPPGTGKTVVLTIKALQWLHQGKSVHLLSTHSCSRAVTRLIEHQLRHTIATASNQLTGGSLTSCPELRTHFYDFERRNEDVESAVKELSSLAHGGELFVVADEAFWGSVRSNTSGAFAEFCERLCSRVPLLHLWAAAVQRFSIPNCLEEERLTTPVRFPPAVTRMVEASQYIVVGPVPDFDRTVSPSPTDGPAVRTFRHWSPGSYLNLCSSEHKGHRPEDCGRCGESVVDILVKELRVGATGQDLQFRDVMILCADPHDNLPVVTCLRSRGVPVQVVASSDEEATVRDVALAVRDAVTVTEWRVVAGLERRVVVVMWWKPGDYDNRLHTMSRCTSLLIFVADEPDPEAKP